MISMAVKCEECNAERGAANHWLELRHAKSAPYFLKWGPRSLRKGTKHVCGQKCAHLILDRHLASLRGDTPSE